MRHLERYSSAVAAKIVKSAKNSPLPILFATFLVRLKIGVFAISPPPHYNPLIKKFSAILRG